MIRNVLLVVLGCVIAIVGGALSLAYVLDTNRTLGAQRIGPWLTFPTAGTDDADPYHKARYAMAGVLSLGAGEGMAFSAEEDSAGEQLTGGCAYRMTGQTSSARFWTLRSEALEDGVWRAGPAIHSRSLQREADNSAVVAIGKRPAPGNWLATRADGPFRLVLTLYDPSTTTTLSSGRLEAPSIERISCNE